MPVKFMTAGDNTLRAIPDLIAIPVNLVAASVDNVVFVADGPYELVAVRERHSGLGAGSSTLDIKKAASGTAPASGTTMLSSTFALDSTANTPVTKNAASGLTATVADRKLAAGDAIAIDLTGTISSLVGTATIYLKRLMTEGGDY